VDSVHYSNSVPWPQAANGLGPSLQRIDERAYGDDPANWRAALPSPGTANLAGTPPVILSQPADVQVMEEANVRLSITSDRTGANSHPHRRCNSPVDSGGAEGTSGTGIVHSGRAHPTGGTRARAIINGGNGVRHAF